MLRVFEEFHIRTLNKYSHYNACNDANLMHYVSLVYSFTISLHVSGLLVAHHQEVTICRSTCCTF
jgi:hypothetical protein